MKRKKKTCFLGKIKHFGMSSAENFTQSAKRQSSVYYPKLDTI